MAHISRKMLEGLVVSTFPLSWPRWAMLVTFRTIVLACLHHLMHVKRVKRHFLYVDAFCWFLFAAYQAITSLIPSELIQYDCHISLQCYAFVQATWMINHRTTYTRITPVWKLGPCYAVFILWYFLPQQRALVSGLFAIILLPFERVWK